MTRKQSARSKTGSARKPNQRVNSRNNVSVNRKRTDPSKTTVGVIAQEVLDYTAGRDAQLDHVLVTADCMGSAAHAVMLSRMPVQPPLFNAAELQKVLDALDDIAARAVQGRFTIRLADQDVHMAVERDLPRRIGELGRRIHTGRSRNDQSALDLRLHARDRLLNVSRYAADFMNALLVFARKHRDVPMVGRSHLQPAMPSSVALWATAYVEEMAENLESLRHVYDLNNRCPLGAAAGYGVPLPIDRNLTSRLLGFDAPVHNVLYAVHARGKNEARILNALGQVMLTLSRLAQDMILFSMPEFGYFRFPPELGTGSSIMPQKNNPDVLELLRARAARLLGHAFGTTELLRALPAGYNRDVQETKEPLLEGLQITDSSLQIMTTLITRLIVNRERLLAAFTPAVFAADHALLLVRQGIPFRDAYRRVKQHPETIEAGDPLENIVAKNHLGAPGGLDFNRYSRQIVATRRWVASTEQRLRRLMQQLLPHA